MEKLGRPPVGRVSSLEDPRGSLRCVCSGVESTRGSERGVKEPPTFPYLFLDLLIRIHHVQYGKGGLFGERRFETSVNLGYGQSRFNKRENRANDNQEVIKPERLSSG